MRESEFPIFASAFIGVHLRFQFLVLQPLPTHKSLNRFILREAELVICRRGLPVAVFGALPELAVVVTGKQRAVLLAFVLEDGDALARQLIGRERDGHLDLVDAPLLPRAAIEPDRALFHPILLAQTPAGFED